MLNMWLNWIARLVYPKMIEYFQQFQLDIFDSEKCVKACPVMASDSNLVRQPFSFVDVETNENIPLLVKPFTMSQGDDDSFNSSSIKF